jgi:hypothetical protein
MNSHAAGEAFVLIDSGTLREVALPPFVIGTSVAIRARGLADDAAHPIVRIVTGEAMRPPSPIDLLAQVAADGSLLLSWTRRSRLGWLWPAGTELPLGESSEKYRIIVEGSAGSLAFEAFSPQTAIAAEALGGMAGAVAISVVQVGDYAESRPAVTSITI